MNTAFKEVQFLPALTAEMVVSDGSNRTFCPLCAKVEPRRRTRASAPADSTRLPRPQADRSRGEAALLALLALSSMLCIGQAVMTAAVMAPNWPKFQAWVAQLLG